MTGQIVWHFMIIKEKKNNKMQRFWSFFIVLSFLGAPHGSPQGLLDLICVPHHQINVSSHKTCISNSFEGEILTKNMLSWLLLLLWGLMRTPRVAPKGYCHQFPKISYSTSKYLLFMTNPKVFYQFI